MLAWYSSIEAVALAGSIARWVGAVVAIVVLVLANRLSSLQSEQKAVERKIANEQIIAAKEQAEKANKLAADLKAQSEPRALSPQQAAVVRDQMFKEFENGISVPIIVGSKMFDPEAEQYAKQISAALPLPPEAIGFSSLGTFSFRGVSIFGVGESAVESAAKVRAAFRAADIQVAEDLHQPASTPLHPEVGVFIFVGYK